MLKKMIFLILGCLLANLPAVNNQIILGDEELENIKLREKLNNYKKYGHPVRQSLETDFLIAGSQEPLLDYKIIDDFEEENSWKIMFNDFRVNNYFDENASEKEPTENFIHWKTLEKGNHDFDLLNPPSKFIFKQDQNKIVGVRAKFHIPGIHFIRMYPKKKIILNKRIAFISLWVFGIRKNLEISIGVSLQGKNIIQLPLGKLDYIGWKLLSADIKKLLRQEPYEDHFTPLQIHFIEVGIRDYRDRKIGVRENQFGLWIDNLGYAFDASLPQPEHKLFAGLNWGDPKKEAENTTNKENQNDSTQQEATATPPQN